MEHYDSIIKAREIIKRKFNELRRGRTETATNLEKHFKPIVNPIKELMQLHKDNFKTTLRHEAVDDLKKKYKKDSNRMDDNLRGEMYIPKVEKFDDSSGNIHLKDNVFQEVINNVGVDDDNVDNDDDDDGIDGSDDRERVTEETDERGSLIDSYILGIMKKKKDFDLRYGIRQVVSGGLMVGNQTVIIDKPNQLIVNNETFYLTPGLLELLCKKIPLDYTASDIENYKRILELTSAHKTHYEPSKKVYRVKSQKYQSVISRLFPPTEEKKNPKSGSGVFIPQKEKTYLYWDNPNELVERLSLLLASKEAGHTAHDREILSIEEELREAGYIK